MKRRVKTLLLFIPTVLLVGVLAAGYLVLGPLLLRPEPAEAYVDYQDQLEGLAFWDSAGKPGIFSQDKYKLMVFVSADCGGCIDSLPLYEKLNRILCDGQNMELVLMWEDKIPQELLKKRNLLQNSYTLRNVRIASTYGSVLLVDPGNAVQFIDSSGGYKNVLLLIQDLGILDSKQMLASANAYLLDTYANTQGKKSLIYFSMPGCPDCEEATPLVYAADVESRYSITRIELERGARVGDIVDEYELYRMAYQIDWYPSFLTLDNAGGYSIIRKVDLSTLKGLLLEDAP